MAVGAWMRSRSANACDVCVHVLVMLVGTDWLSVVVALLFVVTMFTAAAWAVRWVGAYWQHSELVVPGGDGTALRSAERELSITLVGVARDVRDVATSPRYLSRYPSPRIVTSAGPA